MFSGTINAESKKTADDENREHFFLNQNSQTLFLEKYRKLFQTRFDIARVMKQTLAIRELITMCVKSDADLAREERRKKYERRSIKSEAMIALSTAIFFEFLLQKSSTETFKRSSLAWQEIARANSGKAVRPIMEHFVYFLAIVRPIAAMAGLVKVRIERAMVERLTAIVSKRLMDRTRLLDVESALDSDDDLFERMRVKVRDDMQGGGGGGENWNAMVRMLVEAEEVVAFGVPMACERACYAGFGLIESLVALVYHARILNMHFGKERCLYALTFALSMARVKKMSERRKKMRDLFVNQGNADAAFAQKKTRETIAVALQDARSFTAPYALEEDENDPFYDYTRTSAARKNANSLALLPNVQNALELVRRVCIENYFSGSKQIALGAFISNWTIIISVLLTAKAEKPFGIGQACVAAITATHNAFLKLEEIFGADSQVLNTGETHCRNILRLLSASDARDVKMMSGKIAYHREDDGEINWAKKPIIECKNLTLFEEEVVLVIGKENEKPSLLVDSLDFELNAGELCCLSGPPGCGKTTILRAFCGLHTAGSGKILTRFNTGISSNGLFTDEFSYDAEGNASTEYTSIDTETNNTDDNFGKISKKRRQNIAVVPKYPNFPRDGETLLGNDISVNTPDDELFIFPILERLGLGRFCSTAAIQEKRVRDWNKVLAPSERVAVAVARAVAREATLVIVRDNLSQIESRELRAEAYELLRDANCAVIATSSTLLEKKNKNEFNEFEFVVTLPGGSKKGRYTLNVDGKYLSTSAKKKSQVIASRQAGDKDVIDDDFNEDDKILNSAGRAKRAPFQRRAVKGLAKALNINPSRLDKNYKQTPPPLNANANAPAEKLDETKRKLAL